MLLLLFLLIVLVGLLGIIVNATDIDLRKLEIVHKFKEKYYTKE